MRVSVESTDPGYETYINCKNPFAIIIYLDGEKVDSCITADEEKGFVLVYKRDSEGKTIINHNQFDTEVLYGKVIVEILNE